MGRWNCWRLAVRNELSNEGQSLKATAYITIGKTHSGKKKVVVVALYRAQVS